MAPPNLWFPQEIPVPNLPSLSTIHSAVLPTSDNMSTSRNNSTSSTASSSSNTSTTISRPQPRPAFQTRGVGYSGVVEFQRAPGPASDDDVILVTVRLSNPFRRGSKLGADDLPNRPPARSFLRRLSTRLNIDHTAEREQRYKAVKMPRSEYKRFFRRDAQGNYAGTEPEREWDEDEVMATYAEYQDVLLVRVLA